MQESVSPKQVARAIQVSESSIKRWCDKGMIPTQYTAGGHRRIPLSGLLEFLREKNFQLLQPEVLGLPAVSGRSLRVVGRAQEHFVDALLRGDEAGCRQVILDLYLAEHSIARIFDDVIAKAFQTIGRRWECDEAEVFQERHACEISLRILHELRFLIPPPPERSPVAIGAAPSGDQYCLGTAMVELILRDAKWNATSLGDNLPFTTLAGAIRRHRPKLFWLSCSHIADEQAFMDDYTTLFDEFGMDVAFVVGGRALTEPLRHRMKYAAYCDNMGHLDSFSAALRNAIAGGP